MTGRAGSGGKAAVRTVGIGAVAGISADEVLAAVDAVLAAADAVLTAPSAEEPAGTPDVRLATLAARAAEPGMATAAARRGWALTGYAAEDLAVVPVPSPSSRVAALVGTRSVAEAAALLGGGSLIVGKTVHGRVTVAVSA